MPNPTGINNPQPQLGRLSTNPPYGDVKRQASLQGGAPLAGGPTSALNAPRKAQKRAVSGGRPAAGQPVEQVPPAVPDATLDPSAVRRQAWMQVLAEIDDPLIRQYAAADG